MSSLFSQVTHVEVAQPPYALAVALWQTYVHSLRPPMPPATISRIDVLGIALELLESPAPSKNIGLPDELEKAANCVNKLLSHTLCVAGEPEIHGAIEGSMNSSEPVTASTHSARSLPKPSKYT